MKRHIFYIISAMLIALMPVSCRHDGLTDKGTGRLYVDIRQDFSIEEVSPQSKAVPADDMVFAIEIWKDDELVRRYGDYRDLNESHEEFPTGNYRIVAKSVVDGKVDYSVPFYSGSKEFELLPANNVVQITCALANVKVSASFDESISGNGQIKEYSLTVSNGEDAPLVFGSSDGAVKAEGVAAGEGYLRSTESGILDWTFRIVNIEGHETTVSKRIEGAHGQQHYSFSFILEKEDEFGGGYFKIVLDGTMNDRLEYGTVWLGAEDPAIALEGFESGNLTEIKAGDSTPRSLTFSHNHEDEGAGLRSVEISHGNAVLFEAGLPYSVELIGASQDVVSALNAAGIDVQAASEGARELNVGLGAFVANLPLGIYSIAVRTVSCMNTQAEMTLDFIVMTNNDAESVSAEPWACFADLKGKWFSSAKPEGLSFQYRKASDEVWTDFAGEVTADETSRTYTGRITGLLPQTEYIWRAVSAQDKADGKELPEMAFVTETAETVPNLSFDVWTNDSDGLPRPNPTADKNSKDYIWDSANSKAPFVGNLKTTEGVSSPVAVTGEGKQAAKLTSTEFVGKFAAGNIYIGKFLKVDIASMGANLQWGIPFTSRPLALKGWFDYRPNKITHADFGGITTEDMDIGQIQIMLTDWSGPFEVSTGNNKFVDVNADYVLGYGSMDLNATEEYTEFEIKVDWRDVSRRPSYIVIVAAASKYGDYFTGGDQSTLYLDEFELVYDPAELK